MGTTGHEPRLIFCALNDELGIYGHSSEYKLCVINSSGEAVYRIKKSEKRQSVSKKEIDKFIKRSIERRRERGGMQLSEGDLRKMYRFPKYRPFYDRIMKDDEGHIYIFKTKPILSEEKGVNFDLFNKEGYCLYRAKIHDVDPRIIKKGFIYAIKTDPDTGYYRVKRYRIKNWEQIRKGSRVSVISIPRD